jgi:hypothetical protein
MAAAVTRVRGLWVTLDTPQTEQLTFIESDLSLASIAAVERNRASLEAVAEQRSIQRDRLVVTLVAVGPGRHCSPGF